MKTPSFGSFHRMAALIRPLKIRHHGRILFYIRTSHLTFLSVENVATMPPFCSLAWSGVGSIIHSGEAGRSSQPQLANYGGIARRDTRNSLF